MLECGDIVQQIAWNANNVGVVTRLQVAAPASPAENACAFKHVVVDKKIAMGAS